ncbi:SulP family inorganic anion transporter, partial [Bacillus altitudinis]|uniref:SulP family inorganic anion transporter n=1 Tax=Bacillus altitudinis TaxID=293387 RepID=UPI003B52ABBC
MPNLLPPFFPAIPASPIIPQSVINTNAAPRAPLSTFLPPPFLILFIFLLPHLLLQIPMPALLPLIIILSIRTFHSTSFHQLKNNPKTHSLLILVTLLTVVF